MAGKKVCLRCRVEKPIEEFEQLRVMDSRGGYSDYCSECLALNRAEFKANPPKWWKKYMKAIYGR